MKVLMINGSAHEHGCTATALGEVAKILNAEGIETELIQMGSAPVRDCAGCRGCRNLENRCVFDDDMVNGLIEKAKTADGFIFGTPVYYAHPSGRILSLLDRLFYAGGEVFRGKPGAAVASARRAGTTATLDVLNKYFAYAGMPMLGSTYWNMVHGTLPEDVAQDLEGLQTMRNLGRNMAWILKCIELGKQNGLCAPQMENGAKTNFIR